MNNVIREFNVHLTGDGEKAMVFVHGLGCNQEMWRLVAPAFQDDYKIVLLDLIGSGYSDTSQYSPEKYASLQGHSQDVIAVIEALELKDVVYVGHSVSCMIGMLAATQRPELFQRLVMITPSPCYINKADYTGGFTHWEIKQIIEKMNAGIRSWTEQYVPVIINTEGADKEISEMSESFCSGDPDILQQFTEVTFLSDHRDELTKLNIPALILQCPEDIIAPRVVGAYMHKQMQRSALVMLNATGHCPHLTAPAETIEAIKAYLLSSSGMPGENAATGKQLI